MLDPLKSRYRTLLGVDESWLVTNVWLDVAAKRVTIALEFIGRSEDTRLNSSHQ